MVIFWSDDGSRCPLQYLGHCGEVVSSWFWMLGFGYSYNLLGRYTLDPSIASCPSSTVGLVHY